MMFENIITQVIEFLVKTIGSLGYLGIFVFMALESTVFPIPSEVVLIPAGVLMARGELSFFLIVLFSILGTLAGSLVSYTIALHFGRRIIEKSINKYKKFLFLDYSSLQKIDSYFRNHGQITILISRILPVIRHIISLPAGFARMPLSKFCIYTAIGSLIWTIILVYFGYSFGLAIAEQNASLMTMLLFLLSIILVLAYLIARRISR